MERTNIGPESLVQPRSVGIRKNSTLDRSTPALARILRAFCSWDLDSTRIRTVSPGLILRAISANTQGIGANLPGQSVRLWGQPIHVASWGSHSAGILYCGVTSGMTGPTSWESREISK